MSNESKERIDISDDLAHGQVVIITARWILVLAGLLLALWNPGEVLDLRIQVMTILALSGANFYLHSQLLTKRPVLAPVAYAASAADIAVISLIILSQGGFLSNVYVFYFPAVLALSVAFRTEVTFAFAASAIAIYGLIALEAFTHPGVPVGEMAIVMVTRMLMLAAVAVCGNAFWRIERDRRRAAQESGTAIREQLDEDLAVN